MTDYRDALEQFNRASHSDALREMQYVEPIRPTPRRVIRSLFNWQDFALSVAFAALVVIVIPGVLLVLAP